MCGEGGQRVNIFLINVKKNIIDVKRWVEFYKEMNVMTPHSVTLSLDVADGGVSMEEVESVIR